MPDCAASSSAIGVEAHEAAVGDRPVQPSLHGAEPAVQARRDVADVGVQRPELLLDPGGVLDEVVRRSRAEQHPLIGPQTAQPHERDRGHDQRCERDGAGDERDDPRGRAVHGLDATR
jgi:hypothetical protein